MNEPQSQLMSPEAMQSLAADAAKSGMFGITNPSMAICLFAICQAEGLHPVTALKRFHIIEGKPSMRADAMLAEFMAKGGGVIWHARTDQVVSATFFADAKMMNEGGIERARSRDFALSNNDTKTVRECAMPGEDTIQRTIADADAKGLSMSWKQDKQGQWKQEKKTNWKQSPRQMLTARVISEGIRLIAPGVVTGIYAPEEIEDAQEGPQHAPEAPQSNVLTAMKAIVATHKQNALEAKSDAERSRLLGLAADLQSVIDDAEFVPKETKHAEPVKTITDDVPMQHPADNPEPNPEPKTVEVKVDQVDPPEKTKKKGKSTPVESGANLRRDEQPVQNQQIVESEPGDYKLIHVKAPQYAGKALKDLTDPEFNAIYTKRGVALLHAPEGAGGVAGFGLRDEALAIEKFHKSRK